MLQILPDDLSLWLRWLFSYSFLMIRYLLFAGGVYLFYYIIKRREWFVAKIQQKYPERKQIITEIKYSLLTFAVFASISVLIRYLSAQGILEVKTYRDFSEHSIGYFIATTIFIIFFHDTYFYWIHRLMHHPFFYERVHKVHHLSKNPTPWAAFSFHPLEAVLELAFIPILVFTIPLHISSLIILAFWQIVFNVMGHSGYEIFPRNAKNTVIKWLNSSTNHNMHHKYVRCNYGLYFNIWDRLMKTNHPKYFETFEEVTARRDAVFSQAKGEKHDEPTPEIAMGSNSI